MSDQKTSGEVRDYAAFAYDFEACNIDAAAFTHADHIGVAYEMLRKYDFVSACSKYSHSINTIATNAGVPDKFNVTVTLAFLSLIAERIETTAHDNYATFLQRNADLLNSSLLEKWYSRARLRSELARSVFLLPDAAA
ncbi:MAG: hypothetical protein GKR94_22820 [Gammaproteobacteria bacterium]|nr:hypothetical protein [Gammaproteobacteria bacterium]